MWRVIWFFLGVSRLSITGASPEWCMQRLAKARIAFHFCAKPDDFTAEVWILRRDEARAALPLPFLRKILGLAAPHAGENERGAHE